MAGGAASNFPQTNWSLILGASETRDGSRERRLGTLFSLYWKPIYKYLRVRWSKSNEDAKDLVQSFFAHILEGDFLKRYRVEGSRFRTFVKASLDHFVINVHRDESRQKRGGGNPILSIEANVSFEEEPAAAPGEDPATVFDRDWSRTLAETAVARVEADLVAQGKVVYAEVFRAFEFPEPGAEPPSYSDLARRFKISEIDVSNYLQAIRRWIRKAVVDLVRETVTDESALREELAYLTGEQP